MIIAKFPPILHGKRMELQRQLNYVNKRESELNSKWFLVPNKKEKLANLKKYKTAINYELSEVIKQQEEYYGKEKMIEINKEYYENE